MKDITPQAILSLIESAGIAGDIEAIKSGQTLSDAGVDSLDTANVLLAIEEAYEIKIPDEDMHLFGTLDGIVQYLTTRMN